LYHSVSFRRCPCSGSTRGGRADGSCSQSPAAGTSIASFAARRWGCRLCRLYGPPAVCKDYFCVTATKVSTACIDPACLWSADGAPGPDGICAHAPDQIFDLVRPTVSLDVISLVASSCGC